MKPSPPQKLPCFKEGCTAPAPFGFFDPSKKPPLGQPRPMVYACAAHQDEAWERREELLRERELEMAG